MKTMIALATLALGGSFATFAYADDISLGQPGYGGSGCPDASVSATLSPDAKSLSLLFDAYQVEAGGVTGKTACPGKNFPLAKLRNQVSGVATASAYR